MPNRPYAELWKLVEPLAYWSPPRPLTYAGIEQLSKALRSWYFRSGGLFLSRKTRAPYFNLQEALTRLSERRRANDDDRGRRHEGRSEPGRAVRIEVAVGEEAPAADRGRQALGLRVQAARGGILHRRRKRSDEVLEVEDVTLDSFSVGERIFLLQPGEERELKTPIERDGPRAGQTPKVTVTLAGGRQVSSSETPDVPLRTPVLERLGPGS